MVINTNLSAQSSARLLAESSSKLAKSLARLSSGSKITSPEDDAAGLAVSIRFEAQINRTSAAMANVSNAMSYGQTQDGFLRNAGKALDRMSELAVLAQDITKSDPDRDLYQREFQTLGSYISQIAQKDFNGVSLFDNQARSVTADGEGTSFPMEGITLSSSNYSLAEASSISTLSGASTALTHVKAAITDLSASRGTVGATMSRLQFTNEQLAVLKTNLTASNSLLRDTDIAEESTRFAKYNILVQSGTAMLAQANTAAQSVLRLLG